MNVLVKNKVATLVSSIPVAMCMLIELWITQDFLGFSRYLDNYSLETKI